MEHNLDILQYSYDDLLQLFDLDDKIREITMDDIKQAKMKVLRLHPDKSKLDAKYFLFYKKALDKIVFFYNNNNRQNQKVENIDYTTDNINGTAIQPLVADKEGKFLKWFNNRFNEITTKKAKPDDDRNGWFAKEEPVYNVETNVLQSNISNAMNTMKQKTNQLANYKGVENLVSSSCGTNFFEDVDDDDANQYEYISTDPFSQLKYDDLRKVHKDQSIFAVSENDFAKYTPRASVEDLVKERGSQPLTPMNTKWAEALLAETEQQKIERYKQLSQKGNRNTDEYEQQNNSNIATFLRLR
jgi:hypothetical protein